MVAIIISSWRFCQHYYGCCSCWCHYYMLSLGNSVGIPMGIWRPTHTHTHHGSVPTHVGMGMCVGWWVFPMGLPTTATATTTIYHGNNKTTTMLITTMMTTVPTTSISIPTAMTTMIMMIFIATLQPRPLLKAIP